MPLEPSHPDEAVLHHALRDALDRTLTSKDFFVLITVEPSGERQKFEDLEGLALEVERWLRGQDPEHVDVDALPERLFTDKAAEVTVRAIPKKPSARGHRAANIVGNPEPALAGWL